ncbi:hypothetical protein V5799_033451 [Amblyomma americanum]|uniref:Reverse transcriptase domain-containing protein n=1 Tax=Amblyomma americanum TaxID=6943 RepID=A0AAQ4DNA2_AMBAM
MEAIALSHLTWIARVTNFLPEQLTDFRMGRCNADSIADLVSTMEDARHDRDAVMLVLLDVKAAFDILPHSVIHEALSRLGVTGPLLAFVPAFLQGRTFRVHVGGQLSSAQPVAAGVSQGSMLSPFLFNLVMARLPTSLRFRSSYRERCSVNAGDVALWVRGTPRRIRSMRTSLHRALDAAQAYLSSTSLTLSPAKTEALLYHPEGYGHISPHCGSVAGPGEVSRPIDRPASHMASCGDGPPASSTKNRPGSSASPGRG